MAEEIRPETHRLFLGSFVDLELIEAEFSVPIRFVSQKNLHITWNFFGDTQNSQIPGIETRINEISSKIDEISINFNRFELWPNPKFPRLLVLVGDDVNGNATKLYKTFNKRKFNPHITIARLKLKQKPESPIKLPEKLIFPERQISFSKISLIKSTLSPSGSVYSEIRTFNLTSIPK